MKNIKLSKIKKVKKLTNTDQNNSHVRCSFEPIVRQGYSLPGHVVIHTRSELLVTTKKIVICHLNMETKYV